MKSKIFFFLLFISIASISFVPAGNIKKSNSQKHTINTNVKISATYSIDNPYYIIVHKSTYELQVFDDQGWYATYPVVFGSKDLGDKMREGDRRTPDGKFKIILKKINPKWGPELLLNYPDDAAVTKFKERKAEGLVPRSARIGNGIAIHSTRKDEEWTVDDYYNWTDGCISVKYTEMQDLYSYIPVGTPVTIVEK